MKSSQLQFILALVLFVATLVGYFFWYETVTAASSAASALASSISAASTVNQEEQQARSTANGLGGSEQSVDQYFLANADIVPFLEDLQSLGSAAGATVNVVSVGTAPNNTLTLAVALHITGTFAAVVRATGAIEYAPYDLTEQSLSIASDGKGTWHADMAIQVGARQAASSTPPAPPAAGNTAPPASSGSPATAPL